MSYIKFIGENIKHIANIMPFNTQHGISAVRIISEPLETNENGFILYDDDDKVIRNYKDYKFHYEGNSYSVEKDEIEYPSGSDTPLPINAFTKIENSIGNLQVEIGNMQGKVSELNDDVEDITPYVETKTAYIDDTSLVFTDVKQGTVSISAIDRDGISVDVSYERDGDKIMVLFDPLEQVTNITISVQ